MRNCPLHRGYAMPRPPPTHPDRADAPATSPADASVPPPAAPGSPDGAAARVVGVHRVTVTRWRLYHLHFRAELNRRRQEVWGAAADRVRGLLGTAVDVVAGQLASGNPGVQFRAAKALLGLAGA